ncbi:MAG TPA: phage tail protein [Kouleothrix sp.]|uniref:phage tail protein n=1 Tax=Kouleothrix sp. TaxID=2779161 RepID=UPI002B85C8CF|nr:phage tail protein [Kouleothrix sp.]HRC74436.1 phage tail protein [Kouleothrix sp.]
MQDAVLSYWWAGGQPKIVNLQPGTTSITLLPSGESRPGTSAAAQPPTGTQIVFGAPAGGPGAHVADVAYVDGKCTVTLYIAREAVEIEPAEAHGAEPHALDTAKPSVQVLENGDTLRISAFSFRFIQTSRYLAYLPPPFHAEPRDSSVSPRFTGRFLMTFERMLDPLAMLLGQIDAYFSPHTAPASILPYIASWFDLEMFVSLTPEEQRGMLRHALEINHWRSTPYGLMRHIQACTGIIPEIAEWYAAPDGTPTPLASQLPTWLHHQRGQTSPPPNARAGCFSILLPVTLEQPRSGLPAPRLVEIVDAIARLHRPVHSAYEIWAIAGGGAVRYIPSV